MFDWWDTTPPPIVYRTGSTPSSPSMAFTETCTWQPVDSRPLREATALLVALVTHHGLDVPAAWLWGPLTRAGVRDEP